LDDDKRKSIDAHILYAIPFNRFLNVKIPLIMSMKTATNLGNSGSDIFLSINKAPKHITHAMYANTYTYLKSSVILEDISESIVIQVLAWRMKNSIHKIAATIPHVQPILAANIYIIHFFF